MSVADLIPTKLFHCFNDLTRFRFEAEKKCLGNSDKREDQKANLELKHNVHNMFIIQG